MKNHNCLQKAEVMFTNKGLNSLADFRWERALLCMGAYFLPSGRNHSFLVNPQTDQASWKRFLKGTGRNVPELRRMLCELWKRLDGAANLSPQLDAIIAGADLDPWRAAFVRTPAAIKYCSKRLIRWNNHDEVYLLQTTQMNGTHAELFTYWFYENTLNNLSTNGRLKPLQVSYYSAIGTEYRPGIILQFLYNQVWLRFDLEYQSGQYVIFIQLHQVIPHPLIEMALVENLGFTKGYGYRNTYSPDIVESAILKLAEQLKIVPSP